MQQRARTCVSALGADHAFHHLDEGIGLLDWDADEAVLQVPEVQFPLDDPPQSDNVVMQDELPCGPDNWGRVDGDRGAEAAEPFGKGRHTLKRVRASGLLQHIHTGITGSPPAPPTPPPLQFGRPRSACGGTTSARTLPFSGGETTQPRKNTQGSGNRGAKGDRMGVPTGDMARKMRGHSSLKWGRGAMRTQLEPFLGGGL